MLRRRHNIRTRVRARHTGENARINHEDIIGAVDLGVNVYDRGAPGEARVGADFGGAEPVVGSSCADVRVRQWNLQGVNFA